MATLTNKLGLPQAIVDAVKNDGYSRGDANISITGLIAPPRIRVLRQQHEDEIQEDVSERIYSLLGQVMHGILERANKTALAEERFYLDVEGPYETWTVSGAMDAIYADGILQDYKLLSYHKVSGGVPPEYEEQLNLYTVLLKYGKTKDGRTLADIVGHPVDFRRLELVCIFRDWSKGKAEANELMPQQQGLKLEVPRWNEKDSLEFLKLRVAAHQEAERELPLCTDEERWKKPDKWAVMKRGASKAARLHDSRESAEKHVSQLGGAQQGWRVEGRPGSPTRCIQNWCPVTQWCEQWQQEKKIFSKQTKRPLGAKKPLKEGA